MADQATDATQQTIDALEDIWPLQAALNTKAGFDTQGLGESLREAESAGALEEVSELRTHIGRALKNYIDALSSECHELQDCLSWKHWYTEAKEGRQYQLQDLQNARVEATDMLFFWISICQLLGMSCDDVYRLYAKKLGINHRRQDEGRSQAEHIQHEDENRNVT
ncbi:MAG: nucleoside triphosphate pyrophosphohydrolase family protein [Planctomycetota bacterium]|jgi:hypothetical protein